MQRFYYWPKMSSDCTRHVRSCTECQQVNLKPHNFLMAVPRAPIEMLSIDLIQLPLTETGNRYCLMAMCMCTNFIWIIPLKDKQTESVIQAYLQHIYAKFGGSKCILSDRGGEFTSSQMKELAKELGFIKVYVSIQTTSKLCVRKVTWFCKAILDQDGCKSPGRVGHNTPYCQVS